MPHASNEKAGPLCYTQGYVYNRADCLGKGATASVYLGRSRENGTQVAIKVFEGESRHITAARIRETELLRSTNHKNVMRLIDVDREVESGLNVMILEYCQGGSLYNILEQPLNSCGFEEKEFLVFLRDITDGLAYLKSKNIVHRDIKPGNILKKIEEDGRSMYVLTDFGAARTLVDDEETFCSIYGTEEYIHPNMFERGVLRVPGVTHFTSAVDLWSLGVTISHVATGFLPFQAFAGRNDSQKMYEIITGRKSGDVSGIQRSQNGPIERSKDLPETTNISRSLRMLLRPVLAGLFEPDQSKALTFETYNNMVTDIISMRPIQVFYCDKGENLNIYLRSTDCIVHIQEQIASLTDIPADRQLLLLDSKDVNTVVEVNLQFNSFPKSVQKGQFFLVEKDNFDIHKPMIPRIPAIPSLVYNTSLSNDASVSRKAAGVACFIENKTREILDNQRLVLSGLLNIRHYVQAQLKPIQVVVPEIEQLLILTRKRLDSLQTAQKTLSGFGEMLDLFGEHQDIKRILVKFCAPDANLTDVLEKTFKRKEEIVVYLGVLVQKIQEHSAPGPIDHLGCKDEDECLVKAGHLKQGIQTVATTFAKHKKYGELHPHEQFIHNVERDKLENLCVKVLSQTQSCIDNFKHLHYNVQKQQIIMMKHLSREGKVESNIKCVRDCLKQILDKIDKMDATHQQVAEMLPTKIASILSSHTPVPSQTPIPNNNVVRKEMQQSSGYASNISSVKSMEKAELMKQLITSVSSLQSDSSEVDSMLRTNLSSLHELKSMLEQQARLDPASLSRSTNFASRLETVAENDVDLSRSVAGETQISQPPLLDWKNVSVPSTNISSWVDIPSNTPFPSTLHPTSSYQSTPQESNVRGSGDSVRMASAGKRGLVRSASTSSAADLNLPTSNLAHNLAHLNLARSPVMGHASIARSLEQLGSQDKLCSEIPKHTSTMQIVQPLSSDSNTS